MNSEWLMQRERGSHSALVFFTWIVKNLGSHAGRILLPPICLYFFLTSPTARKASKNYLMRATANPVSTASVYRHFSVFAHTLLDRIDILTDRLEGYEIRYHGLEQLESLKKQGRGCLLIGAHFGSFELLRSLAARHGGVVINTVMFEQNAALTAKWMRNQSGPSQYRVIAAGQADTVLRIKECLDRGEWVAMLADRPLPSHATATCDFLGMPAEFPEGPFLIAMLLQTPVAFFFGPRNGTKIYDVHFSVAEPSSVCDTRQGRRESVRQLMASYVEQLENQVRMAPYNWFNFYDFWRQK